MEDIHRTIPSAEGYDHVEEAARKLAIFHFAEVELAQDPNNERKQEEALHHELEKNELMAKLTDEQVVEAITRGDEIVLQEVGTDYEDQFDSDLSINRERSE